MHQRNLARLTAAMFLSGIGMLTIAATASAQTPPPKPPVPVPVAPAPATPTTPAPKSANGSVAPTTDAASAACTVTFNSDSVQVGGAPINLLASLTSAVGDSATASFQSGSMIRVVSVGPAGAANALKLTINTSEAMPGSWNVSIKGSKGECTGKVKVTQ